MTAIKQYAIVRGARRREEVEAYLPDNYSVLVERYVDGRFEFVIEGRDVAGWTMHDYVIPRLGSGLMAVEEIDLSHPLMKTIEAKEEA